MRQNTKNCKAPEMAHVISIIPVPSRLRRKHYAMKLSSRLEQQQFIQGRKDVLIRFVTDATPDENAFSIIERPIVAC